MAKPYRVVVVTIMLCILFVVLSWLQRRYDASDHRKATRIVRDYRANDTGPSIGELLVRRHPKVKSEISWSSEIRSGCLGHVRVFAYARDKGKAKGMTYAFDVNLTGPSIHPTDETTIEILRALTATTTATAT